MFSLVIYSLAFAVPAYLIYRHFSPKPPVIILNETTSERPLKTIMQPPREDLAPPKDDPFTLEELKQFDGTNDNKPIYVSIKGASSHSSTCTWGGWTHGFQALCSMSQTRGILMDREGRTTFLLGKMGRRGWECQVSSRRMPFQTTVI
jgi:Predicted heme/steroid binding protein